MRRMKQRIKPAQQRHDKMFEQLIDTTLFILVQLSLFQGQT
jgi:hypothetical protein